MKAALRAALIVVSALLSSACAQPPERTSEIAKIDLREGYRFNVIEKLRTDLLPKTYIAVSFSGGGTRAAALALGALRGLEETKLLINGRKTSLVNEIDILSSVSGGSVTAAYFALHGRNGFADLEKNFLREDVQGALIRTALNPVTWIRLATPSYSRIDALAEYFDEKVFEAKSYQDLLEAAGDGNDRRPYTIINAADMDTGAVFSFTQDQMDLLCSDLLKLKISDAVAASAAFPVALTALTLKNRSPCKAQRNAPANFFSGWEKKGERNLPSRVVQETDPATLKLNPGRYRRGQLALTYLNEDGRKDYVHLLDGGVADNLGLTLPLTLSTSAHLPGSVLGRINRGELKRAVFIVVNARSEPQKDFGKRATPPGLLATLFTVIGSPIDGSSFLLLDRLQETFAAAATARDLVFQTFIVPVDFDFIKNPLCRRRFKNIATSWALPGNEIDALLALGKAMVQESKAFQDLTKAIDKDLTKAVVGKGASKNTQDTACALLLGKS